MIPGAQFQDHNYARHIGMVPTEVAHHYREYDRTNLQPHEEAEYQKVKANIAEHGIQEPLIMAYSKTTGEAMIGEGNHRLRAARELGITHVPVRAYRQHGPIQGNHSTSRGGRPVPSPPVGNEHGYIPGDLHPSALGLPTKQEH